MFAIMQGKTVQCPFSEEGGGVMTCFEILVIVLMLISIVITILLHFWDK